MNHSTILAKTDVGLRVLKDRSVPLAPRQRSAFIMCDGKHTLGEVLQAMAGMGVVASDVEAMVDGGLLAAAGDGPQAVPAWELPPAGGRAPSGAPPVSNAPRAAPPQDSGRTSQERYREASAIATELTAGLGLRGFRLNLAVEAAMGLEDLRALAPKILAAVGPQKYARLEQALNG